MSGKYLVGIKVEEYRNGIHIGTVYRDIQINVISCPVLFTATLPAPLQNDIYRYASCADTVFTFENDSTNPENIDSLAWQFSHGYSSSEWAPTVSFPGPGTYTGLLVLNPGQGCADTARLEVVIHPDPQADFDYSYDPCVAGPVAYYDRSSGGAPPYSYDWQLQNNNGSTLADPVALYDQPGPFDVQLRVTDAQGCTDSLVREVDYRPAPAVLVVAPDVRLGCAPLPVRFEDRSVPVDSSYRLEWDFGDGTTGVGRTPQHVYTDTGTFNVALRIESPLGCVVDTLFEQLVRVRPAPTAVFDIDGRPNSLDSEVRLTARQADLPRYEWWVGSQVIGETAALAVSLPDTGLHRIRLVVTNDAYCQDTMEQVIRTRPAATFFLPNAFTPNEDGLNEQFRGRGVTRYLSDFELAVFDRHGTQVWRTEEPTDGWDGTYSGRALPGGVYVWQLRYTAAGERIERTGPVVLVR